MGIVDFFEGKSVFITGGSGFLGKVLIEKLLRSCPKMGKIYMLLREKKGRSLEARLNIIKGMALFDRLKQENPQALDKIIPVKGDVCDIGLGLSDADRQMLIDNVNIIYHTAASVRFDDLLRDAIIINVRGTRECIKLALEVKNIALFVHISTTFCNTDKSIVEEELYPPHADWRDTITIAEECNATVLNSMSLKYMNPLPNTYTFAKSLAEHVVNDMCLGKIPAIIVRPSVVISSIEDPIPGWNDNFNGPVGLLVAGGKGLLRTVLANTSTIPDYIPVDVLIRAIIIATHHSGVSRDVNEIEVYNGSQYLLNVITLGEVIDMGADLIRESPFTSILWNPCFSGTRCWYNYYILVILFHMIPAFFLDIGLRLAGKKTIFFSLQRKIYIANCVLSYFMEHTWRFLNYKLISLLGNMAEEDRKLFDVKTTPMTRGEKFEFFKNAKIGAAKFILNEDLTQDREKNLKNLARLRYLDLFVKALFFLFLCWLLIVKVDVIQIFYRSTEKYLINL